MNFEAECRYGREVEISGIDLFSVIMFPSGVQEEKGREIRERRCAKHSRLLILIHGFQRGHSQYAIHSVSFDEGFQMPSDVTILRKTNIQLFLSIIANICIPDCGQLR